MITSLYGQVQCLLVACCWLQLAVGWRQYVGMYHTARKWINTSPVREKIGFPLIRSVLRVAAAMPHQQENLVAEPLATKVYSFVQDELRPYAMKLHTRDQAPKEGQQKAQTPFTKWQPSRANYLQFLVESLEVYDAFEAITHKYEELAPLRKTGLERSAALRSDIEWMLQFDPSLPAPVCGQPGKEYAEFLHKLASESMPRFICHYYNHYFAHTAGGRMIGAKMADLLLESRVLEFYKWEGEVKVLLEETRRKIDAIAATWDESSKRACMEETAATFKYGGSLMASLKPPGDHASGH